MKTAVITGASYGIGAACARVFLDDGWKVYGLSRTKPSFTDEYFVWLECDLRVPQQIAACVENIVEPTIDALISNAGVIEEAAATAVGVESYTRTFAVNVLAPMLLVSALRDKIQQAAIISVSSVSDRLPDPGLALYNSSKAANTWYFDTLANELKNARVYTLLPSYVDTPMQHAMNDGNNEFDWSKCIQPEDIASLSLDLALGKPTVESGANIIVVTDKLVVDLQSIEKLYGYNTDTQELKRL